MPYMVKKEDGKFAVYKKGDDGLPMGKAMGTHATRDEANKQMSALYANEPGVGKKDMDEAMPMMRLEPDDPRAQYQPLGGTDTQACANCQWFCAHEASCGLIWDSVVATGKCNLWLGKPAKADMTMQNPIPVVIVEPPETGSAEAPADAPKKESAIIRWLKDTFGKKQDEPLAKAGFKALPGGKWVSYYTNSFEDKAGELFTEAAHDQYIGWLDKGLIPYPELWYWHIPGTRHGQAEWIGRVDHVVVAAGSFDQTPMADLFRKEYEREPQKTSHTYGYPKQARDADGTYHAYFDVELSPLPANKEANFWTPFMEVKEMPITDEKKSKLEAILGKELAAQVLDNGAKMSADLEALGIKFKEAEGLPTVDTDARDALQALATASKEKTDALTTQIAALTAANTQLVTAVKELADRDAARDKQVADLVAGVKEMFALQPRATQAAQTTVPATNPMVQFLASKQDDPASSPGSSIFDQIAAKALTAAPQS